VGRPLHEQGHSAGPWGRGYVYKHPGEQGEYDLVSFGKDGRRGGEGENADITNH